MAQAQHPATVTAAAAATNAGIFYSFYCCINNTHNVRIPAVKVLIDARSRWPSLYRRSHCGCAQHPVCLFLACLPLIRERKVIENIKLTKMLPSCVYWQAKSKVKVNGPATNHQYNAQRRHAP